MNFNDNELTAIYLAMQNWKPEKHLGKCIRENVMERIDNYFTPGCILYTQVYEDEVKTGDKNEESMQSDSHM